MANYETHRNIGIASSVIATGSIYTLGSQVPYIQNMSLNIITLVLAVFFGFIGSIAPDIDLEHSKPSTYFKKLTYVITLLFTVFFCLNNLSFLSAYGNPYIVSGGVVFGSLILNFILLKLFFSSMVHRGLVHTIPFGAVLSIVLFILISQINIFTDLFSVYGSVIALVFFVGFLTHLILDELYSVNYLGASLKKSFGTAFRLYDPKNIFGTIVLYCIIGVFATLMLGLYSF